MAYGDVHPGYRGLADIATIGNVRFGDASISAKQAVDAPDLIMGDWDHDAYVYGKVEVGGTISGPVTETFTKNNGLWQWGTHREGDCGELSAHDITLYYYCGGSQNNTRTFSNMLVNSIGFSCAAGDVAQFNMDLMGTYAGTWSSQIPPHFTTAEKLITWDIVSVSISVGDEHFTVPSNIAYSNFDFTVANNLTPVYSLGQNATVGLFPFDIVSGLRTITGSISVYDTPNSDGVDFWTQYEAANVSTINFNIGTLSLSMYVRFHRVEPASTVGPVISTIGFTGVSHQSF